MPSYLVTMIALAYRIPESEVVPMLVRWRQSDPQPTYQEIHKRLKDHDPSVEASPQRLSELILEGLGDQRPPARKSRGQEQPA
jgi:hypothetical protein